MSGCGDTLHIGPDTSFGAVVPKGSTWARFNEHAFTVAHGESFVGYGQSLSTIDSAAWAGYDLLSAESVGEFVLVDADVGNGSVGTEGLASGTLSLTTWLLSLADAGVQFTDASIETWGTFALV